MGAGSSGGDLPVCIGGDTAQPWRSEKSMARLLLFRMSSGEKKLSAVRYR